MATANQPEGKKVTDYKGSERVKAFNSLHKEALAQPGVKELMKIHGTLREAAKAVDAWRRAVEPGRRTIITNKSEPEANQPENKKATDHKGSKRVRAYNSMHKKALAQPGVKELMKIHGTLCEAESAVDAWRRSVEPVGYFITTNSSGSVKLKI